MSFRNKYYLIGRNNKKNEIVNISFIKGIKSRLENIDLYTTNFESSEELLKKLYLDNYIDDIDYDVFICNESKKGLYFQEPLFKNREKIRDVAELSLDKKADYVINDSIIDNFCVRMKSDSAFYSLVMYKKTNLYDKFVNYFIEGRFKYINNIKYADGGWARDSYHVLRNILSSYDIFDKYLNNYTSYLSIIDERGKCSSEIIEKCDDNYKLYSSNLFDMDKTNVKK
ncbi:MAG: hypothetical protein IJ842_03985 [Bacilli bacterium]|nr:hypothetical protein [Bacilli bacterium]